MLQVCNNAKDICSSPIQIDIKSLGYDINTENSETNPLISADEEVIFFTRSFSKFFGQVDVEFLKKIYCSYYKNKKWSEPIEISVNNPIPESQISLAGSSPDGNNLFFSIGSDVSSDLYTCQIIDGKCGELTKLPEIINSAFWEGKISITPDGHEMFFSSNRPGGYGGKDLYKVTKDENGTWSSLMNLGPNINTEFDEDAPFIHPDNKALYFSSNGHNTIGGYDIFSSERDSIENEWTEPTNIGYPINTTSNDIGFIISADGNNAYLSSAHDNKFGKHDLYKVILHKTIPLTLIKGTILGGNPPAPIKAKIKVIDHDTKERLRYVYNPNPKTGKYLMIFPPNKNYDMIIEAEGYYPQLLNIFVPNQTYFYELYQEIFLKQVRVSQNDSVIGQEITVTNTFYDIYKTQISDSIYEHNNNLRKQKFDDLLHVVEEIINTSDSLGLEKLDSLATENESMTENNSNKNSKTYDNLLNKIEEAISKEDSTSLLLLDANAVYNDVTNKVFFFDYNKDTPNLTPIIFDKDTIYTLPEINASQNNISSTNIENKKNPQTFNQQVDIKNSPESLRKYIYINYVFYESGSSDILSKYQQMLSGVFQLLLLNNNLGIELHGYTDPIGNPESNLELSKTRAFKVMEYFVTKQIDTRRIITSNHGETGNEKTMSKNELQQQRRVEIKVFEVIKSQE